MKDFDQIEYEQLSQDWRHRDVLTWQFPSVLALVGGVLVAQAFELPGGPPWIRCVVLGFGAGLAICLTTALSRNLHWQKTNQDSITALLRKVGKESTRFALRRIGSHLLRGFSVIVSIVLIGLLISSLPGVFDVSPLAPDGSGSVDLGAID